MQGPPVSLKVPDLKVNPIGLAAIVGYDYEFMFGLLVGISFIQELKPVIQARYTSFVWTLQPTIGYNNLVSLLP